MTKIVFGVILTLFVVNYSSEIKQFAVEIGMREQMVEYLKSWGSPCEIMPAGIKVTKVC